MSGIPLTIHLDRVTFTGLEAAAAERGVTMRELVATSLARSVREAQRRAERKARPRNNGHRLSPEDWAQVAAMDAAGCTAVEIAHAVGCHYRTVETWRSKTRRAAEGRAA